MSMEQKDKAYFHRVAMFLFNKAVLLGIPGYDSWRKIPLSKLNQ